MFSRLDCFSEAECFPETGHFENKIESLHKLKPSFVENFSISPVDPAS